MGDQSDDRFARLQSTIAKRLERVRGTMTDDDFERLVADLARAADRFARIDSDPLARIAMDTEIMQDGAVLE